MPRKRKRCEFEECQTLPYFGVVWKCPRFCSKHKTEDMVNVVDKKCEAPGCKTRPCYGKEIGKRPSHCAKHKTDGMINVINTYCKHPNCKKIANYGLKGNPPSYCAEHMGSSMTNVVAKTCEVIGCNIQPTYALAGQTPRFCTKHKPNNPNMINAKQNVLCTHSDCTKHANYGYVGISVTKCARHAIEGMMYRGKKRCEEKKCKKWAHFGTHGSVPERCEDHQVPTDVDMVLYRCGSCFEPKRLGKDNLCADCGSRYLSYRLCKQRRVKGFLDSLSDFPKYNYYDEIINSQCGRERPDFYWDCETHAVILEVDEDQHKERLESCETARMINITHANFIPCLWIRYNPDGFEGQKSTLRENDRLETLKNTLLRAFKATPKSPADTIRVIRLYYDNYKYIPNFSNRMERIECK